ncbi:MAG: ArsR/SmtB family transcription factor [Pleomorphochaeta sp.]
MKLINNEAVDFIFAMNRFGIRNKEIHLEYPSMEEIKEWCIESEKKLSPFLLNDITLIFEKTIIISLYFFIKVHENNNIKTAQDFLSFLDSFEANQFKSDIINRFLDKSINELTVDNIYNQIINDGLHPGYDEREEAELLFGFLNESDNFLNRLKSTYDQFYNFVYKESKDKFKKIETEKYNWHLKRMNDNAINYLKDLGLNSIINEIENVENLHYYFSFFADNDVSALWDSKNIIIGASTDNRIIQKSAKKKTELLFNCLGDPKRLEILRLTSKRPWYSSELASHFNLKPATLSYHISKLVDADLLTIQKGKSKRFYYTLNKETYKSYLEFASQDLLGVY